jgi:membrane protease YdiL (CAAX protease family)
VSHRRDQLDTHTLRLNLFLTQAMVMAIAAAASLLLHGWHGTRVLFHYPGWPDFAWAGGVTLLIVVSSIAIDRYLPRSWQDDGSVNERIFLDLPIWKTLALCVVVGIGEEWLFRGVVQSLIGNIWTSCLFTLVHIRYLRKPLMLVSVFVTSSLLGFLYDLSSSLLPSIASHIGIDFLLAVYLVYRKG